MKEIRRALSWSPFWNEIDTGCDLSDLPRAGSDNIRQAIKDCNSGQDLRNLANHLMFHILAPLRAKSSTHSFDRTFPRPGWEDSVESVAAEINPSQRQQMRLRKVCLERDQNLCVVSGFYDLAQWDKLPKGHPMRASERVRTQAAHIVPFCCVS